MVTTIEYALMAGRSYQTTRDEFNKFPTPEGWTEFMHVPNNPAYLQFTGVDGFEATSFKRGTGVSTEIVISFAGTYPGKLLGSTNALGIPVDMVADVGLAFGYGSDQLTQSVDYYLSVKAANPGATITLTGHSLGGGLASLVGVFFGVPVTTFDQAPFANSAQDPSITASLNPLNFLFGAPDIAMDMKQYLQGKTFAAGTPEAVARDSMVQQIDGFLTQRQASGGIPNVSLVRNIRVDGEFLSSLPIGVYDTIGNTAPADLITHGPYNDPSMDLHSQSLLTAFLQSDSTATTDAAGKKQTFSEASKKLTALLGLIFDGNMYSFDTDKNKVNLLEHLVRHQAGGVDGVQAGGDAMVTRFTSDLWKLAQDSGLTINESTGLPFTYSNWNNVSKALIAFAMQKYYEENNPNVAYGTELFTDLGAGGIGSNGITFDIANVSQTLNTKIQTGGVKYQDLVNDIKGFGQYFQTYLDTTGLLSSAERTLIKSMLPALRDWYVQAGANGMDATDTMNRGAFMLGGTGQDILTGGTSADLLVGNAGDDRLNGGGGNDTLLGGAGNDTYVYQTNDGLDTILDSDGKGSIVMDGAAPLAGGDQLGDFHVHRDTAGHLYTDVGRGLVIDGNIFVENWKAGDLGLNMNNIAVAFPVSTTPALVGDLAPTDQDTAAAGVQIGYDVLGNVLTDSNIPEVGRADRLHGDSSNDVIIGKGGSDILDGGAGDDRLYADTQIDVATAIATGNLPNTGTGLQGDWLNGGTGSDTLLGGASNDLLAGGGGADLLIGGAGDDALLGDNDTLPWNYPAQAWHYDPAVNDIILENVQYNNPPDPADSGNDVIYAGEGNDYATGGYGNDVIFGENGADTLQGNSGNDVLLGGAGKDHLYGDIPENAAATPVPGDDYLDGGAEDDIIHGNEGNDILIGGANNDTLYGEAGQDTYIFNRGDGNDTVYDLKADNNILRFGAGITEKDITLRLGSLMLDLGNGDAVHIKNSDQNGILTDFDRNDVFNSSSIASFEFDDGSTLTTTELLARGFNLDGTNGDDIIDGTNTVDRINGFDGNDILSGGDGDDTLNGGSGNDTLLGGAGEDTLSGGAGNDTYVVDNPSTGQAQGDIVIENPNEGTDTVRSGISYTLADNVENLTLTGTAASDGRGNALDNVIIGSKVDNMLDGGAGNDSLTGGMGRDALTGGTGADILDGGSGNDTYHFSAGDGYDILRDTDGIDRIFLHGVTAADVAVTLAPDGQSLNINYGAADNITIQGRTGAIEHLAFDDGSAVAFRSLVPPAAGPSVTGSGGADFLEGMRDFSTIAGGLGDDTLIGGNGDTTYVFNRGDGHDALLDFGGMDSIAFGAGIAAANVYFVYNTRGGHAPKFNLMVGGSDVISIVDGEYGVIDSYRFADGTVLTHADLIRQSGWRLRVPPPVTAPQTIYQGYSGWDYVVQGGDGNDVIEDGDMGNVMYIPGVGDDTLNIYMGGEYRYVFNLGDGHDTINAERYSGETLFFGDGITRDSIQIAVTARSYTYWSYTYTLNDLTISYGNQGDTIKVLDGVGGNRIERFVFADGASYDYSGFINMVFGGGGVSGGAEGVGTGEPTGYGTDYEDVIQGTRLADTLAGGGGNDILNGGAGDDTYVFNPGNGVDTINDIAQPGAGNRIVFGPGISTRDIRLNVGSLLLEIGNAGDAIHLSNFDPQNALELRTVESFEFADGTVLTYEELLARGFDLTGSEGADYIQGTSVADRIQGLGGNDTLDGGTGNDTLMGGAGDDRYVFRLGDGADRIEDAQGGDTLFIGSDLTPADLDVRLAGDDLVLNVIGTTDSIVLSGWAVQGEGVKRVEFADGSLLNLPPVARPLADQSTPEDGQYIFTVPAGAFADPDAGDNLTFNATMADGSALPSWLGFDAATQTFSGMPDNRDVGSLNVSVTATDAGGLGADSSFALEVVNVNDAPVAVGTLADQSATEGEAFGFSLSGAPSPGSFLDDATDAGTPDQVWPVYDNYLWGSGGNNTYTFARGDGKVYISDWDNSPVDTVQFTDVLPADIAVAQDQRGTVTLSVNGTGDSLALGYWIGYDEARIEQVIFADGTTWGVNDISSMVSASPTAGSDWISGTDGNDAILALAGDDAIHAGAGDDTVIAGEGNDEMEGDGGSDILSGGSGVDGIYADSGYVDPAGDLLAGGSGDDHLEASISNDLLIGGTGDDEVSGNDGNDVALFNRGDGNDWLYFWSENGVPLAQRTDAVSLGGGIAYADLAFWREWDDLILHVGNGESVSFYGWFDTSWHDNKAIDRLQIIAEAMPGYDPDSADPLLNKRIQQFDFLGLASRFEAALAADPTLTAWQLAPYLADFSLGGSDTSAIGGDMAYLYGKNGNLDGLSETELRAQLNDAVFGMANQTLNGLIPESTVFADADSIHGDSLAYSASLADGSALPSWLTFDAATQTFGGTPGSGDAGVLNVAITATDTGGLTATAFFALTVTDQGVINAAPIAADDYIGIAEDTAQAAIAAAGLLANDTDPNAGDVLALSGFDGVTANGNTVTQDAAGNLMLGIGDRYQSLGAGQTATDSFAYTVSDTSGATSTATVNVIIAGANDAPVAATALADQATAQDAAFSFTILADAFTDIDRGDTLSYGAALADESALPSWLTFDAATQTFSGTPANGDVGSLNVLVTATDTGGLSASSAFSLDVANVNDAPVAANDSVVTHEDAATTSIAVADLLANDYDIDVGDTFTLTGFDAVSANGNTIARDAAGNLVFDIGNRFQSLAAGQAAIDSFSYTIADTAGATSTATVTVTINGLNDGPVTQDDFAGMSQDAAQPVSGNVLSNDSDVDQGAVLGVANAGVIAGSYGSLTLNADGSYSYALDNVLVQSLAAGQIATDIFVYQATDGIATTPATLMVTINGINDAPVAATALAGQATSQDAAFSFTVPASAFTDIDDGDTLTCGAALADGTALPAWLTFDAATQTFSGTPANGDVGSLNVLVTATDTGGLSASSTFSLDVVNVNDAPTANADTGAATEDGGAVLLDAAALLANDIDPDFIHGDALSIVGVSQAASGAAVSLVPSTGSGQAGAVQYDAGSLFQSLAQGQTATDTFGYTVSDTAGATSAATVTMTITGVNDGPVTADDAAAVQEDAVLTATGNVLANDSDIDQGTALTVADASTLQGGYGSLVLNADGSYAYALDNASQAVQSLGRDAWVADRFGYTATDGMAGASSILDVFLNGTNDAPILVTPLADQELAFDRYFSWQASDGSFADIDLGDTLDYAATLADGAALPGWLNFDVATRTFSGETPKEVGSVDVRLIATDKVAATGSTAGSLSVSDVFRVTVSHGNEGVGNGEDAPPPGHDHNRNDGAGASPGHPGSKDGKGHPIASADHPNGNDSPDHASNADTQNKQDANPENTDNADGDRTEALIRSWFDEPSASERYSSFGALDRHDSWGGQVDWQVKRNVDKGISGDIRSEWEKMNARLKKHLEQTCSGDNLFTESGTGYRPSSLLGLQGGQTRLGMGSGDLQMKDFAGLKEGLERLGV